VLRRPRAGASWPPTGRPGGGGDGLGQLGDSAGLDQRSDHDEQAGEEQQGGPFDLAQERLGVAAGEQQQQPGAQEGDHRRLQVQDPVQGEGGGDQGEDGQGADQQVPVGEGLALVQGHEPVDPVGSVGQGAAE
jgi:hypothetical protein